MTTKIDPAASARGGRARTHAKLDALARTQARRRDASTRRQQSLTLPAGFETAADFLRLIADLSGQRIGGRKELAEACQVGTSTVSKWLVVPPKKVPLQPNLDKIVAWWSSLLGADARPVQPGKTTGTAVKTSAPAVSLSRLSPSISERLRKTARRRNLDPLKYVEQILDRQLPRIEELD